MLELLFATNKVRTSPRRYRIKNQVRSYKLRLTSYFQSDLRVQSCFLILQYIGRTGDRVTALTERRRGERTLQNINITT